MAVDQRPGEAGVDQVVEDADEHRGPRVARAAQERAADEDHHQPRQGNHRDPQVAGPHRRHIRRDAERADDLPGTERAEDGERDRAE